VPGCKLKWLVILLKRLSVYHEVLGSDLGSVKRLERHAVLDESICFLYHLVSGFWLDVVFSKGITDFTHPEFSADELLVDVVVTDDVHVVPPSIVVVVEPLLVHSHVNHSVSWEMQSVSSADHLAILDEAKVGSGHGIIMLVVLVGDDYVLSSPAVLREILSGISLTFAASVNTDHGHEATVEWHGLGIKRAWRRVLQEELFHSFSEVLEAELGLGFLVSWCNEDGVGVLLDSLLGSELLSDSKDSLLDVS